MADGEREKLLDAIARNAGIVLSLPSAGMLRHHKSRFLSADPGGGPGFWVESAAGEAPLIDGLIGMKMRAGVSFKSSHAKVVFASTITRRDPSYSMNATTNVEALLLAFPTEIRTVQRRNNYRVKIPGGAELSVRVWRIPEKAHLGDRPMAAQEVICQLRDISTGGLGVTFMGTDGQPPKVSPEDRLRVELATTVGPILVEGRMRHRAETAAMDTQLRAGVQFKALEDNLDGRHVLARLTRIVGELQRDEARRMRLGMCQAG